MESDNDWKSIGEIMQSVYAKRSASSELKNVCQEIKQCKANSYERIVKIRQYYDSMNRHILSQEDGRELHHYMPYLIDWQFVLNKVEYMAWMDIRYMGSLPLYPQYPVLSYVLDFGSPHKKVGFEIDGKDFHDKKKDIIRDIELKKEGWTIFRVSGTEMMRTRVRDYNEIYCAKDLDYNSLSENDKEELEKYFSTTGRGVLEAIKIFYFGGIRGYLEQDRNFITDLSIQTLKDHNYQYDNRSSI